MRHTRLGAALAGVVFAAGVATAQPGGFGPPGGFGGGDRGGDRGDRGDRGGMRGMFGGGGGPPDPGMMWTMMIARGDPNLTQINLNERTDIRDRMLQRGQAIPPDGILTKDMFVANMQQRMASGQFGGPGGGPPGMSSGGSPGMSGGPQGMSFSFGGRGGPSYPDPATATDEQIREAMRRTDRDGDGRVSAEEGSRSDRLRDRFAALDTNRDGFLDVAEYRGYVAVRYAEQLQDQQRSGTQMTSMSTPGGPPGFPGFIPPGGSPSAPGQPQEDERPVAYRFGKLPKEVPSWFEKYDTDQDGQIGLYEWRAAGEPTAKFVEMDQTGDGYLTADEWVRFTRMALEKKPDEGEAAPTGGDRRAGPGGGSSGRNPFAMGGPPSSGSSDSQSGDRRRGPGGPGGGDRGPGAGSGDRGPGGPGGFFRGRGGDRPERDKDKDKSDKK